MAANKGSTVVLLLLSLFSILSSGAAVARTTATVTDDQAASTLDTSDNSQAGLTVLERDDNTTLKCDTAGAPLTKYGVQVSFIEPFCKRLANTQLRSSSVDQNPISQSIQMYLYVGTQSDNWIYTVNKDLCINSFMHIIHKCTEFTSTKGGKWFNEHLKYEIRVVKVGPPFS